MEIMCQVLIPLLLLCFHTRCSTVDVNDYIVDCASCGYAPFPYMDSYTCTVRCQNTEPKVNLTGVYSAIQQEINEDKKNIEELKLNLTTTSETLARALEVLNETRRELNETRELHNEKVAFSVQLEGSPTIASGAIFKYTTIKSNIGGAYNSTTGMFTVPSDGTYQFTMTMMPEGGSAYAEIHSSVDSTRLCQAYGPSNLSGASCNVIKYLHQGDTVYVKNLDFAAVYSRYYNSFSGFAVKIEH